MTLTTIHLADSDLRSSRNTAQCSRDAGEVYCRGTRYLFTLFALFTLLALLALLTLSSPAQQWTFHAIQPVGCVMHAVKMRTVMAGVAVGDSGVIRWSAFYADDAGQRSLLWSTRRWHEPRRFNDVVLLADAGYLAVGEEGTIILADTERDEPRLVTDITAPDPVSSADLLCVDRHNSIIIVGGEDGTVLRSTNNGASFTIVTMPTTNSVVDVCVDGNGRWTAITPTEVLTSLDGASWSVVYTNNEIVQRQITTQPHYIKPNWMLFRVGDDWLAEVSTDGGVTWQSHFRPTDELRISDPDAQALSITASADGMQHSIMFMRREGSNTTIYHYVSFDAGLSWQDMCSLFFTDFVGESQVMLNDTTLITTSLSGQMLTFTRHGLGVQQWWRAPESVNIPFEPWFSHAYQNNSVVGGPDRVLELSFAPRVAEWTMASLNNKFTNLCASSDRTFALVEHRRYDDQFNLVSTAHIYQRSEQYPWESAYANSDSFGGTTIRCDSTGNVVMIPYGKSIAWSDNNGQSYATRSWADTSIWSTSIGTMVNVGEMVGGETVWVQTFRLSEPQAPFMMISNDGGVSWSESGRVPFPALNSASVNGVVVIATAERLGLTQVRVRIARTTDAGATWSEMVNETRAAGITNNVPFTVRGERIACIAPSSVWWSDDAGATWRESIGPTLADDDGLTTGHWTTDTTLVVYSRGGAYHTTTIPRSITGISENLHDEHPAIIVSITAVDVLGRMISVHDRAALPRGVWFVVTVDERGVRRCETLFKP